MANSKGTILNALHHGSAPTISSDVLTTLVSTHSKTVSKTLALSMTISVGTPVVTRITIGIGTNSVCLMIIKLR